jgi:hypothetical protein
LGFDIDEAIKYYLRIASVAFSRDEIEVSERLSWLRETVEQMVRASGLDIDAKMKDNDNNGGNCKT